MIEVDGDEGDAAASKRKAQDQEFLAPERAAERAEIDVRQPGPGVDWPVGLNARLHD